MSTNEALAIPYFTSYAVTKEGTVVNRASGEAIKPTKNGSGNLIVNLKNDNWKWVSPSVARIVLMTYKTLDEDWKLKYAYPVYNDNNRDNVSLDNLDWGFDNFKPPSNPDPDLEYIIPGFSLYWVSPRGRVINAKMKEMSTYISKQGYQMLRVTADSGKSTVVGVHRLMALAFLEHPIDTSNLVVNHKNGNKLDNRIDNLEWVTYSRNIDHAYETGLRTENFELIAVNAETKKQHKFRSLNECARFLGVTPGPVFYCLNIRKTKKPYRGYYIWRVGTNMPDELVKALGKNAHVLQGPPVWKQAA